MPSRFVVTTSITPKSMLLKLHPKKIVGYTTTIIRQKINIVIIYQLVINN
jgi:hypothetical protein